MDKDLGSDWVRFGYKQQWLHDLAAACDVCMQKVNVELVHLISKVLKDALLSARAPRGVCSSVLQKKKQSCKSPVPSAGAMERLLV